MMKISTFFVFAVLSGASTLVNGQAPGHSYTSINEHGQEVTVTYPASYGVSVALKDLPAVEDHDGSVYEKEVHNNRNVIPVANPEGLYVDPNSTQTEPGKRELRAPLVSWMGMNGAFPPDPSGAAGPNHYVQAVNTTWRVYNKTGGAVTTIANLSTLWPGSQNLGDPIVMYDRHADRWFISQFRQSPSNGLLIAVSTTNDPAGTYYQYSYNLTQFPDYPKYSIWWDGYYCTSNSNKRAIVFNRAKMLAGDPTAEMVALDAAGSNQGFRSVLPADADGQLPPNGTPCYFFNAEDDAWSGVPTDRIRIFAMTANWTTPASTSIVQTQLLPVTSWNLNFTGGFANIAQPGTTQRIDAIMQVFMYRAQHTRWVNHNSVVLTCAVNMGSNRSAIRWIELRDANDGNWVVFQEGTYSPDATASRWMSSAAMDQHGNIGMGYSLTDPTNTIYPSIYYTGRLASDPLGQMTFGEQLAIAGTASQTSGDRYGDYAHMSLDPDGSTFWYTGEYLVSGATPRRTRIFSFNLQQQVGIEESSPYYTNLEMTASLQNNEILVNAKGIHGNDELTVDVIGIDGKVVKNNMMYATGGNLTHRFNTENMAAGIYFVRIGNTNFQKTVKIFID